MIKVGVLGGGQLGRMLALAGYPLGLSMRFMDPGADAPAGALGELVTGRFEERAALERFVAGVDVVTYEFENVPTASAAWIAERVPVYPPVAALRAGQDRLAEKGLFTKLGIEVPRYAAATSQAELASAVAEIGTPCVVKTCRMGYDGKGQAVVRSLTEAEGLWERLGGVALIVEAFVPFTSEVSVLGVRGMDGETRVYPLVNNVHEGGILRQSIAPAPNVTRGMQEAAEGYVRSVMEALGYVGVLAIELFEVDGKLLANEMAPRVHNSGHWTIEGAVTSQFENHLRAVCGLPLGDTASRGRAVMVNLIGDAPDAKRWLSMRDAHLHDYGKQARAGRKVGHVTVMDPEFRPPLAWTKER